MRASFVRPIALSSVSFGLLLIAGCEGCGGTNVGGMDAGGGGVISCEVNDDCSGGHCQGGVCVPGLDPNADDDAGSDPLSGEDGGTTEDPIGVLAVLPGTTVEFGAQLLGYPVTVDVTLSNVGDADLTLLALLLDDDTGEFSADPSGTMNVVLAPGDSMLVHVTHTPSDGTPDAAELKVLHDGEGNITTLALFAEFKGDASLSLSEDLAVITPSAEQVNFGEVDSGATVLTTLWVRNTGSSDSILTLDELTVTPATAGFAIENELALPLSIGAWSTALCPSADVAECPPGASACEDTVCVDDAGEPLNAVPIDLSFTAGPLPAQATLTLDHDGAQTDVLLTGLPTQPDIAVSPAEAAFGPVLVGAPTPAEIVVTVENVGAGPLLITKVVEPLTTTVFSFDYSRPVPKVDGDPALRIDSGATPLEVTVTFTPEAAEGYAAVLTLHTSDGDSLSLPITLQGTGVVCQANAHVDPNGACVCDDGHIACGGECKLPGATACGAGCVDCTAVNGIGPGTNASCSIGGSCEYQCAPNYWDIDNATDGNPGGSSWNGCEYACVQQAGFEICNGVDDECDGAIDDGLPRDASDTPTRNDTRAAAKVRSPIDEVPATKAPGSTSTLTGHTLYPAGDQDWFKVTAVEADSGFACANEIPCFEGGQENYQTDFEVISPNGLNYDIEVWAPTGFNYDDPNGEGLNFTDTNSDNKISLEWSRASSFGDCLFCAGFDIGCFEGGYGCAFDDSQVFFVRIKPQAGQSTTFSCEPYELKVTSISLPPGSGA